VTPKPTRGTVIRFAPPIVISEPDLLAAVDTIGKTLRAFR